MFQGDDRRDLDTLTPDHYGLVLDSRTVQDAGVLLGLMGFLDVDQVHGRCRLGLWGCHFDHLSSDPFLGVGQHQLAMGYWALLSSSRRSSRISQDAAFPAIWSR